MKKLFIILLLLCATNIFAQDYKRAAIWYFGENAGIDFNTGPPTALTDGQINTIEGCATMCDTNGNLLFYTDGRTVWNKTHQVMDNGTGLLADASSTQAALIVPYPENDSLYYLFITNGATTFNSGFYYNVINIKGPGEVIEKNKLLHRPISEKLATTRHRNSSDYWVTTTGYQDNNLYTYLVTNEGLISCPVISSVPTAFSGLSQIGAIKFSPSGKLAAIARHLDFKVDILAFNNSIGTFSFLFSLNDFSNGTYGIEFSESEKYLYVMERRGSLLQYNLQNLTQTDVASSKQTIYTVPTTLYDIQGLQLGIDNKIYLAYRKSDYLGVINNPDTIYSQISFDTLGFYLNGKKSSYGMPAVISSYLQRSSADFSYNLNCETNQITLIPKSSPPGRYSWSISNSSSGITVFNSISYTATYNFPDTGLFDLELKISHSTDTIKVKKQVHIKKPYKLSLGNDTVLCAGGSLTLNAGTGQYCYLWQDSSTGATFRTDTAGLYYVKVVTNNFCVYTDSINIAFVNPPAKPTIYRSNDTLYSPVADSIQWFWNNFLINGANDSFYRIDRNGYFHVKIYNQHGCSALSDSFNVTGVGIQKLNALDYFKIYPNPATEYLTIEGNQHIQSVKFINQLGQVYNFTADVINISYLPLGIYYLEITDNQNQIYTTKIIIN
ncbi:MAG TPA: T9SS type A sorting domain-containing protein [Bacteroidia bacterium]|nr:T9SS type A sorting domain-containing protein [Bacteroidia bacterium]